jgi:basic membrane protein A
LINPRGDLAEAINKSNLKVLFGILAGFIIFVFVLWFKYKRIKLREILRKGLVIWVLGLTIIGAILSTCIFNRNNRNPSNFVERIVSEDEEIGINLTVEVDKIFNIAHNHEKICFVPGVDIEENLKDRVIWEGIKIVAGEYGTQASYLQPVVKNDLGYKEVLEKLLQEDCSLIIGNGSKQVSTFTESAKENPDQAFLVLDGNGDNNSLENLRIVEYNMDQGLYIAGYLSAALSRIGKVGIFSCSSNLSCASQKDCFVAGVSDFDKNHQANVTVVGWDAQTQNGNFVSSETSPEQGYAVSERIFSNGVDVILPLTGLDPEASGYGAARSAKDTGGRYVIGYQHDWVSLRPELSDVVVSSIIKRFDQSIAISFEAYLEESSLNNFELATFSSGEIQFSPFRNYSSLLSEKIISEIIQMIENPTTNDCFFKEPVTRNVILPISSVLPTKTTTPTLTTTSSPTMTLTSTPTITPTITYTSTISPQPSIEYPPIIQLSPNPSSEPTQKPTPQSTLTPKPIWNCDCTLDHNCDDFSSHNEAQYCFEYCGGSKDNNWSRLDNDGDGIACERLP